MNYADRGLAALVQLPNVRIGQEQFGPVANPQFVEPPRSPGSVNLPASSGWDNIPWGIVGGFVLVALLFDASRKKGLFDPRGPRLF